MLRVKAGFAVDGREFERRGEDKAARGIDRIVAEVGVLREADGGELIVERAEERGIDGASR